MTSGRAAMTLGAIVYLAAAAGLAAASSAAVSTLEVVFWRAGEPVPGALRQLEIAAFSAAVFALAAIIFATGISACVRNRAVVWFGRAGLAVAGLGGALAAAIVLYGVLVARQSFLKFAAEMPQFDALREAVTDTAGVLHIGFDVLVGAQIALIAAVLFGFCREPVRRGSHRTGAAVAMVAAVFAVLFALLHAANWWLHGVGLESTLDAPGGVAKISVLAEHILGSMNKSLVAALCLMIHCLLIAALAVMLPGPETDSEEDPQRDDYTSR